MMTSFSSSGQSILFCSFLIYGNFLFLENCLIKGSTTTIKASEVVLLNPTNVIDDYYVQGDPFSKEDIENLGLLTRMNSHFYLARFTNGNPEISDSITNFSVNAIRDIALGDIPENNWESYLWFLAGLLLLVILITLLYFFYPPFSYVLNQNMGIVLASSTIRTDFTNWAMALFSLKLKSGK